MSASQPSQLAQYQQHPVKIGVIGGSGLYQMDALTDVEEVSVETPFG